MQSRKLLIILFHCMFKKIRFDRLKKNSNLLFFVITTHVLYGFSSLPFRTLPSIEDENQYRRIRQQLSRIPILQQTQLFKSANLIHIHKHVLNTTLDHENSKSNIIKEKKYHECLVVHYTHEEQLESHKSDIYQTLNQIFFNTPASKVRLIVGNKNSRRIRCELVGSRPLPLVLLATTIAKQTAEIMKNMCQSKFVFRQNWLQEKLGSLLPIGF